LGGILCIIAFFSPAMYLPAFTNIYSYWLWGLEDFNKLSFNTERIDILIIGIIIGVLILISGLKLICSANIVRTEKKTFKDERKTFIMLSLIPILGTIIWIVYIDNTGDGYFLSDGYNVWDYFYIDFGLIGAISGGSLAILGFLLNKIIEDINIMDHLIKISKDKIIIPHKKFPIPEIQKTQRLGALNYCPRCRFKIDETYKFCPGCGFKF
jgi:hypothetical protein